MPDFVIVLIIGGLAGWLAGLAVRGFGFGIVLNVILGIIGGFVGTWLLGELNVTMPGGGHISAILTAFVGAAALLLVAGLIRGGSRRRRA